MFSGRSRGPTGPDLACLIALTAMPFFAIALEATAAHLGWVAPPSLSAVEWIAAAIILAASTWLIVIRMKAPPAAAP